MIAQGWQCSMCCECMRWSCLLYVEQSFQPLYYTFFDIASEGNANTATASSKLMVAELPRLSGDATQGATSLAHSRADLTINDPMWKARSATSDSTVMVRPRLAFT